MLKYPVVLVHGIAAHDRKGIIDFWGRIPQALRERGVDVFFGNTDAWGGYESNAEILMTAINGIISKTGKKRVNIIAHSKGGIDSRYSIWKYNLGARAASLTTIATPHHGSEIADLIYRQKFIHTGPAKKALQSLGKIFKDKNPNMYQVNYQLTTGYMAEFNAKVPMDGNVYYQSFYTAMNNSFDDLMFFYTHAYIYSLRGKNDGLVSAVSSQWGGAVTDLGSGISHAEILDYKKKKISGIDIPSIYTGIAEGLGRKGF